MSRFNKFLVIDEYLSEDAKKKIEEAQTPYTGTHINHTTSISHIKKVYGNSYKVIEMENAWCVVTVPDEIPVTTGFVDKSMAEKFMGWLNSAEVDQKKMLDTISDKKPYIYPMKKDA